MIPVFYIDPPSEDSDEPEGVLLKGHKTVWGFVRERCRACLGMEKKSRNRIESMEDGRESSSLRRTPPSPPRIGKIRVQMTSLFVNVPKNDIMITYNASTKHGTEPTHCWTRIYEELSKSYSKLRQYDAQYLTYAILDQAVDMIEPILHAMRHEMAQQDKILQSTNYQSPVALKRVRHLRKELEKVARKLKPFVRLLVHVIEDDAISPGATVYLRDVLDNLECHEEEVRQLIGDCQAMDEQSDKNQSQQMDRTLYTLTVISAIFLVRKLCLMGCCYFCFQFFSRSLLPSKPAQTLTGVWGMNFE